MASEQATAGTTMTLDELKAAYPGVLTAYEFVKPSYDWMLARFEAADNRLQALQVFATTLSVAIPGGAKALRPDIRLSDWEFVAAFVMFSLLTVVGLMGRLTGGIALVNPRIHQEKWLRWSEWEFKKNSVYWAAEHFRCNAASIAKKQTASAVMVGLFLVELLFLVTWFGSSSSR